MKLKVLSMIATGYNARIICDYLDEEHGVDVSVQNIYQEYIHNPKYKKRLEALRGILDRRLMKHPLASKQARLDILNAAIHECMTWRLDKINYDKQGNEVSRIEKRSMQVIGGLIQQARAEIEGEKPLIDQSHHLHLTVQAVDLDERLKTLRGETLASVMQRN